MKSYLGQKGYSIYKNTLTVKEQIFIRDELSVSPYVPKSISSSNNAPSFPIYRESQNKFYLPRFFGESNFGEISESKLKEPKSIDLEFAGELRDYQNNIINCYMNNIIKGGGLLEIPCGRGKTVMALKIISNLKVKTLVIVHKGFLMDQWIERIEQFLPGAKVGKIQGQEIDIDDKDIVLGMVQSLSTIDYPSYIFEDFGLTIIDECHHMGAEVFVRSLFKIVTKYVLGLSATMQRKDGLTKVFKMFLGDVIYKEKRDDSFDVTVRCYDFIVNDEEFNNTKYDFRGNPAYSSMITKICSYDKRSDFIIKIVKDLIDSDKERQIIILGHNKNLLTYLFKSIESNNIATVGYYVGGMKKEQLKESEDKQIIIATYSMAAEGLDIKTLTTLIMATPKTDVTQSIGRILRTKHSSPLVVDIVDTHDVFKNQFKKRLKYYQQLNYKIFKSSNIDYNNFEEIVSNKKKTKKNSKLSNTDNPLMGKCIIKI